VADQPLIFEPGTRYLYDNSDNIVVGMMVSAVTGQDFPAALDSLVLAPLGLRQTSLRLNNLIPWPYLHGYALEPGKAPDDISRAGLGIFRYDTRCGMVFGHTGNFPGYTPFFASTIDGSRSLAASATEQLSENLEGLQLRRALRARGRRGVRALGIGR
jgi:D-alanyl-D-alanine carboxypeptidase